MTLEYTKNIAELDDVKTHLADSDKWRRSGVGKTRILKLNGTVVVELRKTTHYIRGKMEKTIDIVNISVVESKQRQGIFSSILKMLEEYAKEHELKVLVESIQNQFLWDSLIKRDYGSVYDNDVRTLYK